MQQALGELVVETRGRGFQEVTSRIAGWVRETGIGSGLCTLLLQHTSASLLIQENADPDVRTDFETFLAGLVPDGHPDFIHTAEGPDDMSAHIRATLTGVHLGVPVRDGRLALGTWQGIYLWEHRTRPHTRRIALHLIGERSA